MIRKLSFCASLIALLILTSSQAQAQISAQATMTATPDGANYDYTITLHNTGTTNIETFWFGWLPGYDLLTSSPTVTKTPANWTTFAESGYYGGNSLEFYDSGTSSGIAPGNSSSDFQFTSPDSPAVLQGNDPVYNYYPETYSYVYAGGAEISDANVINSIPITAVPEPPTALAASIGLLAMIGWCAFGSRSQRLVGAMSD
jgi:hypothetical protein